MHRAPALLPASSVAPVVPCRARRSLNRANAPNHGAAWLAPDDPVSTAFHSAKMQL